ncbi:MAG: CDP-diacylglycerol--glycerol-3-phosphate 3-phosphatidyltransferase [Leptonema sp. (in: bacteria)]
MQKYKEDLKKLNLPNTITIFRILLVPIFIFLILSQNFNFRVLGFIIFIIASLSDLIDGYFARKWNQATELGKFLDPLADKFLVTGALITFIFMSEQIEIWMILSIVGRDFLITILRTIAIKKGTSLKTSMFGKVKTAFQMFSIIVILLSFLSISYKQRALINESYVKLKEEGYSTFEIAFRNLIDFVNGNYSNVLFSISSFLPYTLMLLTTIITIISGLRYLYSNYNLLLPSNKGE